LSTEVLIVRISRTTTALYLITVVHHVIEGLGWVFGFRLNSLLTPITFGIPLLMTLGVLQLYKTTRHAFVLAAVTIMITLFWVIGIGLTDGFYNHTLNVLLAIIHAPASVFTAVYPTYAPAPLGTGPDMPCDGVQYSYCTLTPITVLYELAGVVSFTVACWLAFDTYRLVCVRREDCRASFDRVPRRVTIGVALALLSSLGVGPTLGVYMATRNVASLLVSLVLMAVGVGALCVALRATRAPHAAPRAI
jgi:hypothetical protein